MQGLADGYFILPYTIGHYLAQAKLAPLDAGHAAFRDAERAVRDRAERLLGVNGPRSVDSFHRELGRVMWDACGMARTAAGLRQARERVRELGARFWREVFVGGRGEELNQALERAGRVADFFEFADLLLVDALHREESCGGHFREEYQTAEGEAQRDDARFAYVAAWEYAGAAAEPRLHKEPLEFAHVPLAQRSYK
jgi:succinate dehydrogenase / fumarate reductase flavoprotein subunit